jgi:hypothetical protein
LSSHVRLTRIVRRAASWRYVGPAVLTLLVLAEIGGRTSPPPVNLVLWCFASAATALLAKLAVWVATSYRTFTRDERLVVVLVILAVAGSWYAARMWVFERQFDDFVATQNKDLKLTLNELSGRILVFVSDRTRHAPAPPKPETWDRDEADIMRFQDGVQIEFEANFGSQVRAAHDVLAQLGLTDRDFERFYRHPADTFEMRVVATKLAFFSSKIPS